MAKTSDTSISKTQAAKFIASATKDEELSCEKIKGFHLRKTQKGGTWRIRYTDFSGKIRKLSFKCGKNITMSSNIFFPITRTIFKELYSQITIS